METKFIDGRYSTGTYLILGQKEGDNLRIAVRRLDGWDGDKPVFRIHAYPNLDEFNLSEAADALDESVMQTRMMRDDYETIWIAGEQAARDFLMPGLLTRGVEALEFDQAMEALRAAASAENDHASDEGENESDDEDDEPNVHDW